MHHAREFDRARRHIGEHQYSIQAIHEPLGLFPPVLRVRSEAQLVPGKIGLLTLIFPLESRRHSDQLSK
jgi:hypothetical protein